jgi:hypothetical protein
MDPWGEVGYKEERVLPGRVLRKEFDLSKKVKRATAYVSGLGLFEFYVNGAKVSDHVLSPGLTEYNKRTLYVTYDVTRRLAAGRNAMGLLLGNGRYWAPRVLVPTGMRSFGYPKAIVQLNLEYIDGSTSSVVSDQTWKLTTNGPIRANNEYDGEEHDARMELKGWDRAASTIRNGRRHSGCRRRWVRLPLKWRSHCASRKPSSRSKSRKFVQAFISLTWARTWSAGAGSRSPVQEALRSRCVTPRR